MSDIERTLAIVGSIASVVGLVITIVVLLNVRRIEQSYARQALVPRLGSKLAANAKNLNKSLRTKAFDKIGPELAKCRANLEGLARALPESEKTAVQNLLGAVSGELQKGEATRSDERLLRIVDELKAIVQQIKNLEDEWKWRSRDAS